MKDNGHTFAVDILGSIPYDVGEPCLLPLKNRDHRGASTFFLILWIPFRSSQRTVPTHTISIVGTSRSLEPDWMKFWFGFA